MWHIQNLSTQREELLLSHSIGLGLEGNMKFGLLHLVFQNHQSEKEAVLAM